MLLKLMSYYHFHYYHYYHQIICKHLYNNRMICKLVGTPSHNDWSAGCILTPCTSLGTWGSHPRPRQWALGHEVFIPAPSASLETWGSCPCPRQWVQNMRLASLPSAPAQRHEAHIPDTSNGPWDVKLLSVMWNTGNRPRDVRLASLTLAMGKG